MDEVEKLKARIADLERAIQDANDSLRYGEGINLLYYMDRTSGEGQTIAEVIGE